MRPSAGRHLPVATGHVRIRIAGTKVGAPARQYAIHIRDHVAEILVALRGASAPLRGQGSPADGVKLNGRCENSLDYRTSNQMEDR
jgi:hypothetical protein